MNKKQRNLLPEQLQVDDPAINKMLRRARVVDLRRRKTVFHRGDGCERYLLVLEGQIKVVLSSPAGREVLLYHVMPGDSCVLTTSCLLGGDHYPATGIAETPVTAVTIDQKPFLDTMNESEAFRQFVFENFGKRLANIIERIEQVSLGGVDARIASCLLKQPKPSNINMSHQEIAAEIGSAREVVSRRLKVFEENGWLKRGRCSIKVTRPAQLRKLINQ